MKKLVLFLSCSLLLVGLSNCGGGGKYGDAKDVYNEMIALTEEFISKCDNAPDAQEAVAAYEDYLDSLFEMRPRLGRVMRKHPELKEEDPQVDDAEMQNLLDRVKELQDEMNDAMAALKEEFGSEYKKGLKRVNKKWSPF